MKSIPHMCKGFDGRAYEIPYSGKIPEEMYVFFLGLMQQDLSEESILEMQKTEELQKVVLEILSRRMAEYETTLEEDEALLNREDLSLRKRMGVAVRVSEKRILKKARERIDAWVISPPTKRQKHNRQNNVSLSEMDDEIDGPKS